MDGTLDRVIDDWPPTLGTNADFMSQHPIHLRAYYNKLFRLED